MDTKNVLVVEHMWNEPGFCRVYYRLLKRTINGETVDLKKKYKKPVLVCSQEEIEGQLAWYSVCNDGTYFEPNSPLRRDLVIITPDGKVLREYETDEPLNIQPASE